MKRSTLMLFTLTLLLQATAQRAGFKAYIDSFTKKNQFNGTILIQNKVTLLYEKSFGLANVEHLVKNKKETRYRIASLTKLFTAVLIMQLYEEGKLELNRPIHTYLPGYKGAGGAVVTIHQLLNHTSGISNMDTVKSLESALIHGVPVYQQPLTTDALLDRYCSGPLVNTPGAVFDYNNADYVILGKIIEQLRHASFDSVLHQKILRPLRLTNTGMAYQENIIPNLAANYFYRDDIKRLVPDLPFYNQNWYAAGSMYSTSGDILQFTTALFSKKILKKETLDLMFVSGKDEYGYGVWVYENYKIGGKMYRIIKRPGSIMGAQTMLFHILEANVTILILCNTGTVSLDELAADLAKRVGL
jgi:D-alanyl-D-alanine carboxypeptidase